MSYTVSQRTQELGIRMALGARQSDICALVLRAGLALTLPGLLLGVAVALSASRLLTGMLVQVDAADPISFAAAALFVGLVALLASYVPALRAARLAPMTALRCE
jgi:putative ABC transport system permease protein